MFYVYFFDIRMAMRSAGWDADSTIRFTHRRGERLVGAYYCL